MDSAFKVPGFTKHTQWQRGGVRIKPEIILNTKFKTSKLTRVEWKNNYTDIISTDRIIVYMDRSKKL